jgi:hypothetical protein
MAGTLKLVEQKLMVDEVKKHIQTVSTKVLMAHSTQYAAIEDHSEMVCNLEVVGM